MDYQSCLDYLHSHCARNVPGGLERTRRMAALLGNPQENVPTIHIAGTNGKGSTAAMLESALRRAGYRVGLYTSPHLERYEERIQINREPIPEALFAALLTRLIETVVPQLLAEGQPHPGEFELLTVAGWLYFAGRADIVISEVGLGGALDPTNAIQKPLLAVFTPISLDHCEILGDTVTAIARDKAGIMKPGVPAVTARQTPEVLAVLKERAEALGTPLIVAEPSDAQPETNLAGAYQRINCAAALASLRVLAQRGAVRITEREINEALQTVYWPGRMEYLPLDETRGVLLDGAHNPAGMESLAENLHALYGDRRVVLLLSILDDKARRAMLETILPLAESVILTRPEQDDRAKNWRALAREIETVRPELPLAVCDNLRAGLREAVDHLEHGQILCVTGSLHLLGDCRRLLRELLPGVPR